MAVFCAEIKPQIQVCNTEFTLQFLEFIANLRNAPLQHVQFNPPHPLMSR